jgi:pyridoxamine 5'-phosphate oxidase family protein
MTAARTSVFTEGELAYLQSGESELAHVATVGADGTPHVVPTGWRYNPDHDSIDLGGIDLTHTKKYRDLARHSAVALVVDDVLPSWRPRGIEIRGHAELIDHPEERIRIRARRIVSWGIDSDARNGRNVTTRSRR